MAPDAKEQQALDDALLSLFFGRNKRAMCGFCFYRPAVCIHEIDPRSQRPLDWWDPENRIPLCHLCHEMIHREGTKLMATKIKSRRIIALQRLGVQVGITVSEPEPVESRSRRWKRF